MLRAPDFERGLMGLAGISTVFRCREDDTEGGKCVWFLAVAWRALLLKNVLVVLVGRWCRKTLDNEASNVTKPFALDILDKYVSITRCLHLQECRTSNPNKSYWALTCVIPD